MFGPRETSAGAGDISDDSYVTGTLSRSRTFVTIHTSRCGRPRLDGQPCRKPAYWADGTCRLHVDDPEVAEPPDRDVRCPVEGDQVLLYLGGLGCGPTRRVVALSPEGARHLAIALLRQADRAEAGGRDG